MPAAYVVLSHTEPEQVTRLVEAVLASSPAASVLVTHDARRHPAPVIGDERVRVVSHGRPTDWGSWELVEVTLEAMRAARDAVDPDLVVLVSGQCYPVRPLAAWEDELRAAGGWQGTARPLDYTPAWGARYGRGDDELTRYTYAWFRTRPLDGPVRRDTSLGRVARALAHRVEPVAALRLVDRGRGVHVGVRRRMPAPAARIHLGSQWLAVDRQRLELVLQGLAPGAALRSVYERSVIADESALQTVLANAAPPAVARPVSYSVWLPEADTTRTFTLDDLAEIRASGSPFCRKVHSERSATLMDALDRGNGVRRDDG
ncbi:core-2/I-branching beta-1,6-N-acetylglucosaminyltransferase family protein [Terrabacter terrigena]|uniref:Core-2/I-Branching enzyme n=1 Tax=Terrabacter terrigena TaxID=574718 RepID=A0ABW3MVF1_9MICO